MNTCMHSKAQPVQEFATKKSLSGSHQFYSPTKLSSPEELLKLEKPQHGWSLCPSEFGMRNDQ